jgi:hypothetical protein
MLYAIDSMTQKQVFAQIVSTLIKILKIYAKSADYKKCVLVQNKSDLLLMIIKQVWCRRGNCQHALIKFTKDVFDKI